MTDRTDINDLLLAWRDDDVTPAEYEALVAALRTPAGRRALVEEWTFATAAREVLSMTPGSHDQVVAIDDGELESLLADRARRASRDFDRRDLGRPAVLFSFRRWPARVAAVAAAVAVAAGAFWYATRPAIHPTEARNPSPTPVAVATQPSTRPAAVAPDAGAIARVAEMSGGLEVLDAAGRATPAFVGQLVRAGQTLRTVGDEGFAAIEYPDGSRVEMSVDTVARFGDAVADAAAGKRVYFSAGVIRADVTPQPAGRPMVVASPQAEIRVVGTRFSVASAMPDTTRVDLESGRVELVRTSDGRMIEMEAGSYALARADLKPMVVDALPRFLATPRKVLGSKWASSVVAVGADGAGDGPAVVTANGRFVEYWGTDGRVTKLSIIDRLGEGGPAVFAPDGSVAAAASSRGGQVMIWDVAARRELTTIQTHGHPVNTLAVAPGGAWVAVVDPKRPNVVRVLDAVGGADGIDRFTFAADATQVRCLAVGPDGTLLAVGTQSDKRVSPSQHRIELYDARTGRKVGALPGHARGVRSLAFSPDGTRLASSGDDGVLRVWDVPTRSLARQMDGHEQSLGTLAFSPDGGLLAGGGGDGRVWVWDARTGGERLVVHAGFRAVRSVAFVPDGRHLLTHTFDGPVTVWDLQQAIDRPTPGARPAGGGTVRATVPGGPAVR